MNIRKIATALLIAGFLLQPIYAIVDQPKPEDFNTFPVPTKGTEKDPKLVYEKQNTDGSKTTITASERETSMFVVGSLAVGLTLIAVVGAGILSGKINVSEVTRAWRGGGAKN